MLYQAKAPIRQAAPGVGPGPDPSLPHRGLIKAPASWVSELGAGTGEGELGELGQTRKASWGTELGAVGYENLTELDASWSCGRKP